MRLLELNEEFVVFLRGYPSLLCYVDAVLKNYEVRCVVVNGAWSFIMDQKTGHAAWQAPHGSDQDVFEWVPLKLIPGVPRGGYNTVLQYIEESGYKVGKRPPLKLVVRSWYGRALSFTSRLKEALAAFCSVMAGTGKLKSVKKDTLEDDDIPF